MFAGRGGGGLLLTAKNSQNLSTEHRKPGMLTEKQTGSSDFFNNISSCGIPGKTRFPSPEIRCYMCGWKGRELLVIFLVCFIRNRILGTRIEQIR